MELRGLRGAIVRRRSVRFPGCGIFSTRHIRPDSVLGEYRGQRRSTTYRGDTTYCAYSSKWFKGEHGWEKGCYIDAIANQCLARYVNHCFKTEFGHNAILREMYGDGRLYLVTVRGIETDDEILIDYGEGYWTHAKQNVIHGEMR